mmetsp:Transcript_35776/g.93604  ORF Transcript_35776/g.93604 Transcript_35776/m.93604 type:complete len:203 (+) Transcript_35776:2673-3281(+)
MLLRHCRDHTLARGFKGNGRDEPNYRDCSNDLKPPLDNVALPQSYRPIAGPRGTNVAIRRSAHSGDPIARAVGVLDGGDWLLPLRVPECQDTVLTPRHKVALGDHDDAVDRLPGAIEDGVRFLHHLPQPDGAVTPAAANGTVSVEGAQGEDAFLVPIKRLHIRHGVQIPDLDGAVEGPREELVGFASERECCDGVTVPLEFA